MMEKWDREQTVKRNLRPIKLEEQRSRDRREKIERQKGIDRETKEKR